MKHNRRIAIILSLACFIVAVFSVACGTKNDEFTLTFEKEFKILVLPDIQIESEEWEEKGDVYQSVVTTINNLIDRTTPDLIVLLGDLSYGKDKKLYLEIGEFVNSFKTPWTLVWGNHDQPSGLDFLEDVAKEYCEKFENVVFAVGDKNLGNGNFVIKLRQNGKNVSALFFIDTHNLVEENGSRYYAKVTDKQKKWFLKKSKSLKKQGFKDILVAMHIPLKAYEEAYYAANAYEGYLDDITLEDSYNPDFWKEGYKDSFGIMRERVAANPNDDFIETIIEADMKATVIAAHDHVNNFVINYRGLKLAYALKTGIGCYYNKSLNGGTLIKINETGVYDLHHEYVKL